MCFGVPAKVVSCGEGMVVEVRGKERGVIPMCDCSPGDFVMVAQGVAVSRLSREEAEALEALLNES